MGSTRTKGGTSKRGTAGIAKRYNVVTSGNDRLSAGLADIVPDDCIGSERYLDIVQWNLEWWGASKSKERDRQRFDLVLNILDTLNGDLFIFQEVAGPSSDGRYKGSMDVVADELRDRGAGDYAIFYTRAGGDQRIAMMYDREWLRAKTDVEDLFPMGKYKTATGTDAFGKRTPLYGFFEARIPADKTDPLYYAGDRFDFQALGVHLKAMQNGGPERLVSANILADWLTNEAPKTDSDALIIGDWNAPPDDKCWAPIHALEKANKVAFSDINDPSDFSQLWLENRKDKFVSRIDLTCMTLSSEQQVAGGAAKVVRWKPIQQTIAEAGKIADKKVVGVMKQLKENISDHMPVVSRFYFTKRTAPE